MHRRYLQAPPPQQGEHQSLAYRLRLLFLDRWNLWHRFTRYRLCKGPKGEQLDGTNNACERAIGWWIKERYRSMRSDIGPGECRAGQLLPGLVWQFPQPGRSRPCLLASAVSPLCKGNSPFSRLALSYQFSNSHTSPTLFTIVLFSAMVNVLPLASTSS